MKPRRGRRRLVRHGRPRASSTRKATSASPGDRKDLIKSGGEWINPAEIETIIGALPEVALVAVVGRAAPQMGRAPGADRRAAKGEQLTDEAVARCASCTSCQLVVARCHGARRLHAARNDWEDRQAAFAG